MSVSYIYNMILPSENTHSKMHDLSSDIYDTSLLEELIMMPQSWSSQQHQIEKKSMNIHCKVLSNNTKQ